MSETKHTELPWFLHNDEQTILFMDAGVSRTIAEAHYGQREERAANARLIVRAVNAYERDRETIKALVEALQRCNVVMAAYVNHDEVEMCAFAEAQAEAEAALALARAEGE